MVDSPHNKRGKKKKRLISEKLDQKINKKRCLN